MGREVGLGGYDGGFAPSWPSDVAITLPFVFIESCGLDPGIPYSGYSGWSDLDNSIPGFSFSFPYLNVLVRKCGTATESPEYGCSAESELFIGVASIYFRPNERRKTNDLCLLKYVFCVHIITLQISQSNYRW